jgi:hypothetical protein
MEAILIDICRTARLYTSPIATSVKGRGQLLETLKNYIGKQVCDTIDSICILAAFMLWSDSASLPYPYISADKYTYVCHICFCFARNTLV